jgi:multiple sugar transport system permease protein
MDAKTISVDLSLNPTAKKINTQAQRDLLKGILFISPWLIGFLVFMLIPFVLSFYYSFTDYDIVSKPHWIGFENYNQLFHDAIFWKSLYNTLYFTFFSVPLSCVVGILLALLLNLKVRGMAIYRTIFYLPSIVPVVASSILWLWLLDPQFGIVNSFLGFFGIPGPGWLVDPNWSKPALVIMSIWGVGNAMIIYLAGIQDIPGELYESAAMDGASWFDKFFRITLPMLSPVILFNVIIGLIGSFQYFTQAYIITSGGPNESTLFYPYYLYNNAFSYFHMGYASAMAWILFVIILSVTLLVFKSSAFWVHYSGDK